MPNPACQVKENAGAYVSTSGGVDVTPGNTVTINLIDTSADSWSIECVYTDDTSVAATVTSSLSIDTNLRTATFTAPAAGKTYIFRSKVNNGVGPDGKVKSSYSTTFGIYTLTAGGLRVIAANETTEGGDFGWVEPVNTALRAGLGGGDTLPDPTGHAGDVLVVNGTGDDYELADITELPDLVGNAGKALGVNQTEDAIDFDVRVIEAGAGGSISRVVDGQGIDQVYGGAQMMAVPRLGVPGTATYDGVDLNDSAFSSEGFASLNTFNGGLTDRTIGPTEYTRSCLKFSTGATGARSVYFPLPATDDASYAKDLINASGQDHEVCVNDAQPSALLTVTMADGDLGRFWFTPEGVYGPFGGAGTAPGGGVFDPATLALSGWWRASYGGSPWAGVASAGASSGRNLSEATNPPSVAGALNGLTPANFDGTNDELDGPTGTDLMTAAAYSGAALVFVDGISTNNDPTSAPFVNDAILSSAGTGDFGVGLRDNGGTRTVNVWHYHGSGYAAVSETIALSAWQLVQWKYDGTNLKIRVNGGTWQSAAGANVNLLTPATRIGASYNAGEFFDGQIAELMTAAVVLSDADFDDIKDYINDRYGLAL